MGDLLLGFLEFGGDLVEQVPHCFLSVEHGSSLLVAGDVIFNLLLQVLVDFLVLKDAHQALVNLGVEDFILVGQFQMVLS